jgi:hypothetical protein
LTTEYSEHTEGKRDSEIGFASGDLELYEEVTDELYRIFFPFGERGEG